MKIAFLVTFAPTTRVVVDVKDSSLEQGDDFIKVITAARNQIIRNGIDEYINSDSCTDVEEDKGCPYNEWDD